MAAPAPAPVPRYQFALPAGAGARCGQPAARCCSVAGADIASVPPAGEAGFVREGITPAGMSSAYRVLPAMDPVASGCSPAVGIATFATLVFRSTTGGALHAVHHDTRLRATATVEVRSEGRGGGKERVRSCRTRW